MNGAIPFSLDPLHLGPILSYQLKAVWLFNFFITGFFLWKLTKEETIPVYGLFFSEATAFLVMLYFNVLNSLTSGAMSLILMLFYTGLVTLLLLIALGITAFYRKKLKYNVQPEATTGC